VIDAIQRNERKNEETVQMVKDAEKRMRAKIKKVGKGLGEKEEQIRNEIESVQKNALAKV